MPIDLIDLYKKAFGSRFPTMFPTINFVNIGTANHNIEASIQEKPSFLPLTIDGYTFPIEPMISVKGSKQIKSTFIYHQDIDISGSVKEQIALKDYEITIQGVLINDQSNDLPQEDIRQIRTICEDVKNPIKEVDNSFLEMFKIFKIAITGFSFPGIPGEQNAQSYIINAISDKPAEIQYAEKLLLKK